MRSAEQSPARLNAIYMRGNGGSGGRGGDDGCLDLRRWSWESGHGCGGGSGVIAYLVQSEGMGNLLDLAASQAMGSVGQMARLLYHWP